MSHAMRRKDRAVTEMPEILGILEKCEILRLGLSDGGTPYIVPLNFGWAMEKETPVFYFHSALEGRKIQILRVNPHVCFEADCSFKLRPAPKSCEWTAEYESVIGYGTVEFVETPEGKSKAMDCLLRRYGLQGKTEYPPQALAQTAVFRLVVTEITGKRNLLGE